MATNLHVAKSKQPGLAPPIVPRSKLLIKTLELMDTCGKSAAILSRETGLSYYWLTSLKYKEIEPGVNKTVLLYEHLSGKKLEV